MYIAPNTIVKVFKNCPLDKTYENTILFSTRADQTAYFSSLVGYTFTNNTYQRVNKGKIRVAMSVESLYNCNYMAFQNASFENKWFYAFINSIEYINNVTSEITYEIDVMQTWHFDYILTQCMVEREHSATDEPGDNTIPENLELGEYILTDFGVTGQLRPYSIVVACTFDANLQDVTGDLYAGVYSGLCFHAFDNDASGVSACNAFIANAVNNGKVNGIVSIFLMAKNMITTAGSTLPAGRTFTISKKTTGAIDGYIPRNKKLYTYPFNFLYVTNMQGSAGIYPYEYFSTSDCQFTLAGDMSPNPSVILRPKNYKGLTENDDEKMVLSGYPQLCYNIDSYKAWLAQNGASLAVNSISAAFTAVANPLAGVASAAGIISQVYEHAIMPNQARGGAGSATNCAMGYQEFSVGHKHIRAEYLGIIDGYFDMFGYACHRVKIPDRVNRPEWNYVKTIGCKIDPAYNSGLPGDDMEKIENIYNSGVRFWHDPAHIGNYSYSNAPVTTP